MAIAWLIQERVNNHDRLALKIFKTLEYGDVYKRSAAQYFSENPEDLMMGQKTFQIRVVSFLKDSFTHRQMRKIIREHGINRVAVQAEMVKTRGEVKTIAKQVGKSYEALLRMPNSEVPSRRRRRR